MVKNTVGGGKSKKIARKLTTSYVSKEFTRFSINELEQYALVTKIYGNGRCQVKTHTGMDLQCIIRNKFKGRSKRGNIVSNGTYVLIGLREWESSSGYKTSDLLEIYDNEDLVVLQNQPLFKKLVSNTSEKDTDDELFSMIDIENTDDTCRSLPTISESIASNLNVINEEVYFDDI